MKWILPAILILCSATFAVLYSIEKQRINIQESRIAQLQQEVEVMKARVPSSTSSDDARELEERFRQKSAARSRGIQESRAQTPEPKKPAGLGALMKSPLIKGLMNNSAMVDNMIEQQYGSFFKEMNLPPDQLQQVKELLRERHKSMMNMAMEMFDQEGGMDMEKLASAGLQIQEQQQQINDQLRLVMGDEAFARFEWHEKSAPERMQMENLKRNFDNVGLGLEPAQADELVRIMYEARESVTPTPPNPYDPAAIQDQVNLVSKMEENFEEISRRILQQARPVLSADQFIEFEIFQENDLQMKRQAAVLSKQLMPSFFQTKTKPKP